MVEKLIIQFKIELAKVADSNYDVLASCLLAIPFFTIEQAQTEAKTIKIKDAKTLKKVIKGNHILNLYPAEASLDNVVVIFAYDSDSFDVTITTTHSYGLAISDLEKFIVDFIHPFQSLKPTGINALIEPYDEQVDYPKIRPPKVREILGNASIIQWIDLHYLRAKNASAEFQDAVAKLLEAIKKDDTVQVIEFNGCFLLTWVASLEIEAINTGLANRDAMIAGIPDPLDGDFNALGDKNIINLNWAEKLSEPDFFSFYEEDAEFGIKLVVTQNGILDQELANEFKAQAAKMTLADGRPISVILAVTSNRDEAIAFQTFKEFGIYKVLYLDDELNIWDVNPRGNWKN